MPGLGWTWMRFYLTIIKWDTKIGSLMDMTTCFRFPFQQQSSTVSFSQSLWRLVDQRTGMAVSCEGSWLSTVQGRSGSTTLTSLHLCYRWLRRSGKAVAEGSVKGSANSSTNSVQQSSNVLVCLQHDVLQAIIAFSRDVAGLPKQSCQFFIFCHILLLTAVEACNSHLNLPWTWRPSSSIQLPHPWTQWFSLVTRW